MKSAMSKAKADWKAAEPRYRQNVLWSLIMAREGAVRRANEAHHLGFKELSHNILKNVVAYEAAIALLNDGQLMGKPTTLTLAT
jgi:hypothetical protein